MLKRHNWMKKCYMRHEPWRSLSSHTTLWLSPLAPCAFRSSHGQPWGRKSGSMVPPGSPLRGYLPHRWAFLCLSFLSVKVPQSSLPLPLWDQIMGRDLMDLSMISCCWQELSLGSGRLAFLKCQWGWVVWSFKTRGCLSDTGTSGILGFQGWMLKGSAVYAGKLTLRKESPDL